MIDITSHLGLVVATVKRLGVSRRNFDDAIGEGNLALVNAAAAFDPNAGVQFSTFATACITNAVRNMGRSEGRERVRVDRLMAATTEEMLSESPVDPDSGVLKAIETLDPRTQEILRLRIVDGLNLEQVAEKIGLGKSRVQVLEKQGLERLREILGK